MSFIDGLDICAVCGDTNGPWGLYKGRWLCDSCIERAEEYEKGNSEGFDCHEAKGTERTDNEAEETMG